MRFTHVDTRRNGGDILVRKYAHDAKQCLWFDDRIGIETAYKFCIRIGKRNIHGCVFASVFFLKYPDATGALELTQYRERGVGRTVVNRDDVELLFRVVKHEKRVNSIAHGLSF